LVLALVGIAACGRDRREEEAVARDVEAVTDSGGVHPGIARRFERLEGAAELRARLQAHGEVLHAADEVEVGVLAVFVLQ
jgi:hypothetical protein